MKVEIAVKGIIINRKLGKILLTKRSADDDNDANSWENCGGSMEAGEMPEESLRREIREEAGISDIVIIGQPYVTFVNRAVDPFLVIAYLCETNTENIVLSAEHQDYKWVDKDECKKILATSINEDYVKHKIYELNWGEV